MKKWMLFLPGLFFVFDLRAQDAMQLLKQVKEKLATVHDYVAEGTMKTDVSFLKAPDSRVTIYFRQPDKINIKKQDGISIIPKGGISINFSALLNEGSYTAVDAGNTSIGNTQVRIIKLLPLAENADVVLATLSIDPQKNLILKASTTTRSAGSYDVSMVYGKYAGYGLPDKLVFTFDTREYKMPKGVTFDYDDGSAKQNKKTPADAKGKIEVQYNSYLINKGVSDAMFTEKK